MRICKCNQCGEYYEDDLYSSESFEFDEDTLLVVPEPLEFDEDEGTHNCPLCGTDAYLTDVTEENKWEYLADTKKKPDMRYSIHRDVYNGLYYAVSFDYANEYGRGPTPEEALVSLRIRINQIKKKENK